MRRRVYLMLALVAGCQASPTTPVRHASTPQATSGASASPTATSSAAPNAPPTPTLQASPTPAPGQTAAVLPSPAPIAALHGILTMPQALGGQLLANNGAGVVSNNGAGVVSNNGGGYRLAAALFEGPVPNTKVTLQTATGQVIATATTDAQGRYTFPDVGVDRNMVVAAVLPANAGTAQAVVPKAATAVDLDLVSTLTTTYILDRYVSSQQDPAATLDRLPADVEAATRTKARAALESGSTPLPDALDPQKVGATVASLRATDAAFDGQLETVRKLLVVGGYSIGVTDGAASQAQLGYPTGLALDAAGNLYVSDTVNHQLRKITPDGQVKTLAGSGEKGFADGVGQAAKFSAPYGLALDAAGNLYVADSGNNRIRKVAPDGSVSTFAGTGVDGFADGATAQFSFPHDLGFDAAGNLYVGDQGNQVIRKIAKDGTVSSVAGSGHGGLGFGHPGYVQFEESGLAVGPDGTLVVARGFQSSFLRIGPDLAVTPFAGGDPFGGTSVDGQGTAARIFASGLLGRAADGTIYFCETEAHHVVRKVAPDGTVTTLAGAGPIGSNDGPAAQATFYSPSMALPAPDGSVYIADTANSRIRKLQDGVVSTYAGSGKRRLVDGNAADARFDWPTSVLVDAKGNVLVCDAENRALRKVTPAGQVTTLAGSGEIRQAGETGDGPGPQAKFTYALYMAADGQGNIYLNDSGSIRKVAPDGVVSTYANGIEPVRWLYGRGGVAVDAKGTLFVADGAILRYVNGSFERFAGKQTGFADGKGEAAMFNGPQGMCFDAAGNLIVADTGNHRIRMVAPDGTVTTLAGSGQAGKADGSALQASFNQPNGVSLDPDGGILVADTGNNAIRRIFQGKVTTYAVPDLDAPQGVAMLKDGRLVVADTKHDQVKVLVP